MAETKPQEIEMTLDEQVGAGEFSNLAAINHSGSEFIIDFVRLMPGLPKGKVVSRIILTPDHAKRFLSALRDNMAKFEKNVGVIKTQEIGIPNFKVTGRGGEA